MSFHIGGVFTEWLPDAVRRQKPTPDIGLAAQGRFRGVHHPMSARRHSPSLLRNQDRAQIAVADLSVLWDVGSPQKGSRRIIDDDVVALVGRAGPGDVQPSSGSGGPGPRSLQADAAVGEGSGRSRNHWYMQFISITGALLHRCRIVSYSSVAGLNDRQPELPASDVVASYAEATVKPCQRALGETARNSVLRTVNGNSPDNVPCDYRTVATESRWESRWFGQAIEFGSILG